MKKLPKIFHIIICVIQITWHFTGDKKSSFCEIANIQTEGARKNVYMYDMSLSQRSGGYDLKAVRHMVIFGMIHRPSVRK